MRDKFNLGIEISEGVSKTALPSKIKRYDVVKKKEVKKSTVSKSKFYRYRPGLNTSIIGDLDA